MGEDRLIALDTKICRRASCSDWKEGIGMSEKKLELAMDSKEANRRYQYIQELNDAYLQKRLVIFYGAGLSMQLGLPSWSDLIQYVMEKVIESPQQRRECSEEIKKGSFWDAMERVKDIAKVNDARIKSLIAECIKSSQDNNVEILSAKDNNYRDLAESEVSIFITTNYDTFLNKVDPQCDSYDIDGLKDQANANFFSRSEKRKRVLYLHGHVNKESSIIITKKAVEEIYRNEKWISVFQGLLNNYHILFLGVSLSDEYLRKFLSKNVENTKNSYFVITSENVEMDCKKIAVPEDFEKRAAYIREILEKIKERPRETVWIRVWVKADNQKAFQENVEKQMEKIGDVKIEFITKRNKDYVIIAAMHMKKSNAIEEAFKRYKTIFKRKNVEKYIEDLGGTVYFYSCNEEDFHGKEYQAVFKNDIQVLMQCKIGEESRRGYIVNQIGLDFPDTETDEDKEMFKKFQTVRWKEMGKEYTFYKDESILIKDAQVYGVEVHVSGFCFFDDRLLMEKRSEKAAIASGMVAPVGGRMRPGEDFTQALERHFREDCNLLIAEARVCNTFKTFNANVPGVAFLCNSSGIYKKAGKPKVNYALYTKEELLEIHEEGKLACTKELLLEAFAQKQKIRKKTIKLRIVLWSNCCYNCQGCHHENLSNTSVVYHSDAVLENLKKLESLFDVRQITITGGEPMQDIDQLEALLKEIDRYFPMTDVAVITNGERLNKEVIEKFAKYNVRYKVSLYGYDNESFEAYTGCKNYRKKAYLVSFIQKLQLLNERKIRFTVNIPVHKYIISGLRLLLEDECMQEVLLRQNSQVKIIDMVKPRNEDGDLFQELYVPIQNAEQGLLEVDTTCVSSSYEELKSNLNFFVYPCKECKGENVECFENFALTLEPNGKLLVCKNAVEHLKFDGKSFTEFLSGKGIEVELAEYNKEYGG